MSQAGILALTGSVPSNVPIDFVTNSGTATSVANTLNVLGAGGTTTAGSGNTVTITTVTGGMTWTDEAAGFTADANNGYFCTAALTALLPAIPSQGNVVQIICDTASAVVVQANAGQMIRIGAELSSSGGTATSTAQGDNLNLVYRASGATWIALSADATWLVA